MSRASAKRRSERSKSAKPNSEERIEFADDDQVVIIHDELAEVGIDDPTFGGMRSDEVEEAFEHVVAKLRTFHEERFRHQPPANALELFEEIADELLIPKEEDLRLLIRKTVEREHFTVEERERVVKAAKRFRAKQLVFSE